MKTTPANVHLGDGVVVVRRHGSSASAVANILGTVQKEGIKLLFLDRLVHKPFENELGGYAIRGAISSILTVPLETVAAS
jgi:hypothetical protein